MNENYKSNNIRLQLDMTTEQLATFLAEAVVAYIYNHNLAADYAILNTLFDEVEEHFGSKLINHQSIAKLAGIKKEFAEPSGGGVN